MTIEVAWTYANPRTKIKTPEAYEIKGKLGAITASLQDLVDWLNRPNRDSGQSLKLKSIKVLVQVFGYDPYIGEIYRGMRVKPNPKLKVGSKLRLIVGQYKLTSWSINPRGAAEFGRKLKNNTTEVVVGRLVSDELQVASIVWVKAIVAHLVRQGVDCGRYAPKIAALGKQLDKFIDNEEEVIMYITGSARVEVVSIL